MIYILCAFTNSTDMTFDVQKVIDVLILLRNISTFKTITKKMHVYGMSFLKMKEFPLQKTIHLCRKILIIL